MSEIFGATMHIDLRFFFLSTCSDLVSAQNVSLLFGPSLEKSKGCFCFLWNDLWRTFSFIGEKWKSHYKCAWTFSIIHSLVARIRPRIYASYISHLSRVPLADYVHLFVRGLRWSVHRRWARITWASALDLNRSNRPLDFGGREFCALHSLSGKENPDSFVFF